MTEYLLTLKTKAIKKCKINLIDADTGCGKTTFIFGKDGLIFNTNAFVDTRYEFSINLNRVLYVCDTNMLKDEITSDNEQIIDILELKANKSYKEAKFNFERLIQNNGKIKICTYRLLGILMGDRYQRSQILNSFDLIIFDEAHKVVEYSKKLDTATDTTYTNLIDSLSSFAKHSLFICLTATPYLLDKQINQMHDDVKEIYSYVLSASAHEKLRKYNIRDRIYCNYIMNYLKDLCIKYEEYSNKVKEKKILIYTKTINKQKKIKKMLCEAGYKAEYLCSKDKLDTEEQKKLRKYLIEKKEYPSDLEILIINDAYDTGWNLKADNIAIILVDSANSTTIKQVRGRVRADINILLSTLTNKYIENEVINFKLPRCYIEIKLNSEIKRKLIETYGTTYKDNKCNWQTFKKDLHVNGYDIRATKNGSYIYLKNELQNDACLNNKENSEDVEVEVVCKYFKLITGKKLFNGDEKLSVINVLKCVTTEGKIPKKRGIINDKLKKSNIPYRIEAGKSNGKRYWIVVQI